MMAFKSFAFILLSFLLVSAKLASEQNNDSSAIHFRNRQPHRHPILRLPVKSQVSNLIDKHVPYPLQNNHLKVESSNANKNDLNLESKQEELNLLDSNRQPMVNRNELRELGSNATSNEPKSIDKPLDVNENLSTSSSILNNDHLTTPNYLNEETITDSNNLDDLKSNNSVSNDKTGDLESDLDNHLLKETIKNLGNEDHLDVTLGNVEHGKSEDSSSNEHEAIAGLDNYTAVSSDNESDDDDDEEDEEDDDDQDEENKEEEADTKKTKKQQKAELKKTKKEKKEKSKDNSIRKKLEEFFANHIGKQTDKQEKDRVVNLIHSSKDDDNRNKIKQVFGKYKLLIKKMKFKKENKQDQIDGQETTVTPLVSIDKTVNEKSINESANEPGLNTELNTELNNEINNELNTELNAELNTELTNDNQSMITSNSNEEQTTSESSTNSKIELSSVNNFDTELTTTQSPILSIHKVMVNESLPTDAVINDNLHTESETAIFSDQIDDNQPTTIYPIGHLDHETHENEEPTTLASDEIV